MSQRQRRQPGLSLLPDEVLAQLAGFLGAAAEVLRLAEVCLEWREAVPSNSPVWNLFLLELGVKSSLKCSYSSPSSCETYRQTRRRHDFKGNFVRSVQAQCRSIRTNHQQLLLTVKNLFEKNKRDCRTLMEKTIRHYFPPRDFSKHFNVNSRSELLEGYSLLNLCARYGRYKCMRYLLCELQANPDTADDGGFTPFLNACYRGDIEIVKLLHAHNASTNRSGCLRGGQPKCAIYWTLQSHYVENAQEVLSYLRLNNLCQDHSLSESAYENLTFANKVKTKKWCNCESNETSPNWLACSSDTCPIEWFHVECMGISSIDNVPDTWYCPTCAST